MRGALAIGVPELREFERPSTTVAEAYVLLLMAHDVARLEA